MIKRYLLLAEDDELLGALLCYRLEKAGFVVELARNGREVKEYLEQNKPDVIVSDIMMPYFSGIELIDYVRHHLGLQTPMIIISSAGNEDNVLSAFELGADDFIPKPISPAELIARIERVLCNV